MERQWGKTEGVQTNIYGPTLHAHVPPGGRLLDSTTVVLPGLKYKLIRITQVQSYN